VVSLTGFPTSPCRRPGTAVPGFHIPPLRGCGVCQSIAGRQLRAGIPSAALCDTYSMQSPLQTPAASTDPKSVKVHLTTGAGMDIEWGDGHVSHYGFVYLRDACPCAMCEDERGKTGRRPGDPATAAPGALLIFKPTAKPLSAEGVGKYAIKFSWNDNHDLGIYSWKFLREVCPCDECRKSRAEG
jgi:DUF971 family protein